VFIEPSGSLLDLARNAPRVDIARLAPPGTVLIVAPHPDDETFGCGAALAAAAAAGRQIAIVLLTDGEGSHPQSVAYSPTRLADLRIAELRSALKHLTGSEDIALVRLSQPDGQTRSDDLARIDYSSLERFARQRGTSIIWSTWQEDPHCDHETAAALAGRLADLLDLPMWSFAVWGRFGDRAVTGLTPHRFDPGDQLDAKRRAVAAYQSQTTNLIADDPTGFVMPPALVDHFINAPELFLERR
jgi:LmbE family N-acetylglucosaminyl deacetylase